MRILASALSVALSLGIAMAAVANTVPANAPANAAPATVQEQAQVDGLQQQINELQNAVDKDKQLLSEFMGAYHRGGYLYAGINADYPLANLPDTSFVSELLAERHTFTHPLTLSGLIEFDAQAWGGSKLTTDSGSTYHRGSDVALTAAKLYFLFAANEWASFLTDVKTNTDSSVSIENAALIVGDLKTSPFYAAVGQFALPFGVFGGGGPFTYPLNKMAFKDGTMVQAELGYNKNGLNVAASAFNTAGTFSSNISDFVVSTEYQYQVNQQISVNVGAGYLNDIRGTTSGIGSSYDTATTGVLHGKRNAAYDFNGTLNINDLGLFAEYDRTQRSASYGTDSGATGDTGKMSAWVTSASYNYPLFGKDATYTVTYGRTHNMANIPASLSGDAKTGPSASKGFKSEWIASGAYELIKNVYLGPEYQYAELYDDAGHTWTATLDVAAYF